MTSTTESPFEIVEIRGAEWVGRAVAGCEDAVAKFLDREDLEAPAGFELVKESRVRRIARGVLQSESGALDVHVKLHRAVRLSDRARDAVLGARAAREFEHLCVAHARGVPCVEPVAVATRFGSFGARSLLLTRSVDALAMRREPWDADVAARAGRLLRRAHDAGLHARDLHPGNVLVGADGALRLVDLTSVAWAQPLDDEERARAIAFFCSDLDGGVRHSAAAPLLAAYEASSTVVDLAIRDGLRLRNRLLSAFGRRAFRPCRHTRVEIPRRGPHWYHHVPGEDLLSEARAAIESPPEPVKSGRRGSVHLADRVVVKWRPVAATRRLWRAAYWLAYAGVPVPRPVVMRVFDGSGVLAVERCPGLPLDREIAAGLSEAHVLVAAGHLGDAVGRLHAHGLRNRDMKLENLVRDPGTGVVTMVDLDGVRRKIALDRRGQGADLGRLLAAFENAGAPGGARTIRRFVRGYVRARSSLGQPARLRMLARVAVERAGAMSEAP